MAQVAIGNVPLLTRKIRLGDLPVIPVAGGRTTYEIDTAKNIHAVHLLWTIAGVGATEVEMKAEIADIRVKVGGKLIYDLTATQILDLYHYYRDCDGAIVFDGQLPLIFTPMNLPLSHETQQYAIGMLSDKDRSKRNTFVIEINMTAGPITVDACEIQLEYDDEPADTIGYHVRQLRYGTAWAAASRQTLDKIAHESNALAVLAYHVHHPTAGTLTRYDLKVNDSEVISDTPLALNNLLLQRAGRTPVADYESIDFALANHPKAFLDISRLVNEYLGLTWGVPPTGYEVIVQQLCKNLS
jgi:hypothetical protein